MHILFNVVYAGFARGTHHKLALDALTQLRGPDAGMWREAFLAHHRAYLDGAKAPDDLFKDFRNHVLHVRENHWGGAVGACQQWYAATVDALRDRQWRDAVYNAGVLSHYYTDPIQPFHTGQSDAEGNIHRAFEWSVCKAYEEIREILEGKFGFPKIELPKTDDWLAAMVVAGAEAANPHYETLVERYDFAAGTKDPPSGLDQTSKEILARLVGHAVSGFARILERAFDDARVAPPRCNNILQALFSTLQAPVKYITNRLADADERALVEAMYEEFQRTGRVTQNLPEDDRAIRDQYAQEVLKTQASVAARPRGPAALAAAGRTSRAPVVDNAPRLAGARPVDTRGEAAFAPQETRPAPRETPRQVEDDAARETPVASGHSAATPAAAQSAAAAPLVESGASSPARTSPLNKASTLTSQPASAAKTSAPLATPLSAPAASTAKPAPALKPASAARAAPAAKTNSTAATPLAGKASAGRRDAGTRDAAPGANLAETVRLPASRFHLETGSPIVEAPSIGEKTAQRLGSIGLRTVGDLLACDPQDVAARVGARHITAATVADWQDQARLVCQTPNLRGRDAQILVACDRRTVADVASSDAEDLHYGVEKFLNTKEGEWIARSGKKPTLAEVQSWIEAARQVRQTRAA